MTWGDGRWACADEDVCAHDAGSASGLGHAQSKVQQLGQGCVVCRLGRDSGRAAWLLGFLGRPDSVALGYVAGLIGAGSYLLGGLMGVIAYAWILDGLSPTGTTVSAVVGGTWFALLVPWVLTRGPFPGLGPEPRR